MFEALTNGLAVTSDAILSVSTGMEARQFIEDKLLSRLFVEEWEHDFFESHFTLQVPVSEATDREGNTVVQIDTVTLDLVQTRFHDEDRFYLPVELYGFDFYQSELAPLLGVRVHLAGELIGGMLSLSRDTVLKIRGDIRMIREIMTHHPNVLSDEAIRLPS